MSDIKIRIMKSLSDYWKEHHIPPDLRTLCEEVGNGSTSYVSGVLAALENDGLVRKEKGKYIPVWVDDLFRGVQ